MGLLSGLAKVDGFAKSKDHVQVRTLSGASGVCVSASPPAAPRVGVATSSARQGGCARTLPAGCHAEAAAPAPVVGADPRAPPAAPALRPHAVSLVTFTLMAVLCLSEVVRYRTKRLENHLMVDKSQGEREVTVTLDMDFPGLPCKDGEVRVEDSKGIVYDDARIHISKFPIVSGCLAAARARDMRPAPPTPPPPPLTILSLRVPHSHPAPPGAERARRGRRR